MALGNKLGLTSSADLAREEERISKKKAAELLRSRRYNISEVAAMTGFPDSSYFSTAFKRQYGMSPRKYLSEEPG